MTRISLKAIALCMLLIGSASSQESKTKNIDWISVREAFETYCQLPLVENAERILTVMPDGIGYQEGDSKEFESAIRYIFDGRPIKVLNKLILKGDKYALRIGFRTFFIALNSDDDAKAGILVGKAIRVDPIWFLEEFKASGLKNAFLELIVTGFGWEDEGYPELSDREIRLRLRSLQSVDRPDLIDIRDICISRLKGEQEIRRRRDDHGLYRPER